MSNLIFLIFSMIKISFISSRNYCGSSIPLNSDSCSRYTDIDSYCCFLTTYYNNFYSNMCYSIKKTEYFNLNRKIKFNNVQYDINCGVAMGTLCGTINNPIDYKDCAISSLDTNQCCYVEYKSKKNCVWLSAGNTGELEYEGIVIKCAGERIKESVLVVLIMFFLIII